MCRPEVLCAEKRSRLFKKKKTNTESFYNVSSMRPPRQRDIRSRAWVGTCNNFTDEDVLAFRGLATESVYSICGYEHTTQDNPETSGSTPHLQVYIYFANARGGRAISSILKRFRLAKAKGTATENRTYCSKEGIFEESGTPPIDPKERGDAERARWALARKSATDGKLDEVPDDIFVRYYSALRSIAKDYAVQPPDNGHLCGVWITGASGAGKSRRARHENPGAFIKSKNKWWDGYRSESAVILDDVDPGDDKWLGYFLKIWSDHYAFPAEIKGGCLQIRPEKFIVTSQYLIHQVFTDFKTVEALERRFEVIYID